MQYSVKETSNFASLEELKAAYYGSPHLEVRAGVIHALTRDGNPYHNLTLFPLKEQAIFMLEVCQECLAEAHELHTLVKNTPYPPPTASREEQMRVTWQKNAWTSKERQLCKMASQCILYPIAAYIAQRENTWGGPVTWADESTGAVLKLISSWESAPYLEMGAEPLKRKVGKFLEVYDRHNSEQLPDMWYQAVIHSRTFGLLFDKPWEIVRQQILEYLKISSEQDGVSFWGKLKISHLCGHAGYSAPVVQFIIQRMYSNGELDSLVDLGVVRE